MMKQTVVTCCNDCPLLNTSGYTMYCKHPAVSGSEDTAHIVTRYHRETSTTPEQCPLRTDALVTVIKLSER